MILETLDVAIFFAFFPFQFLIIFMISIARRTGTEFQTAAKSRQNLFYKLVHPPGLWGFVAPPFYHVTQRLKLHKPESGLSDSRL